ncbi:Transposase IS4 [Popillia japonica]|uniref:Transposase IS4 n=1 Tax=Popillia japonica TaxID=7064 RepID=A0AAW1LX48_POPJA
MASSSRFYAEHPLFQDELENIAEQMFQEPESDDEGAVSDKDSDLSDEDIFIDDSDSLSEQSVSDQEIEGEDSVATNFFIGKDGLTKWSKFSYATVSKTKKPNNINNGAGVNQCAKDIGNELESFLKIIDLTMINEIVTYTNTYIDDRRKQNDCTRYRDCKNTTISEFMAYLGLLYLIGVKKSHHVNVKEIWSTDGTGIEIARATMSYRRFLFLTRSLRFDDRASRAERRNIDKLAAIRTFSDAFVSNCKACYTPSAYTTIDEMLHPFSRTFSDAFVSNCKACYTPSAYTTIDEMLHPFRGRLLNICGINAQVLYSFAKPDICPKYRRIFLTNLALSLMKELVLNIDEYS